MLEYQEDPYERYREQPNGCRDMLIAIFVTILLLVVLCCTSCKTQQCIPVQRDSVRVEFKHDSVFVFKHDSVFRDRWRSGDTVFVTVEKWQTLWRDKITEVHDTISTNEVQVQEVKYVPAYYKNTSAGFWVLFALLLVIITVKAVKIYVKFKTGGRT